MSIRDEAIGTWIPDDQKPCENCGSVDLNEMSCIECDPDNEYGRNEND